MTHESPPLRVLLADDHPVVRAGLVAMISETLDITVVAEARTGVEALRLILEVKPDVAIVDLSMPLINGLAVLDQAVASGSATRIIILTMHEERVFVQQALSSGARGYLLKRLAGENLLHAIRAVSAGGLYLDPAIAGSHLAKGASSVPRGQRRGDAGPLPLSVREEEVLRQIAAGFTSKEVATKFSISAKSVETHKARALEKLNVKSRAELVRYAMTRGWLAGALDAPPS